MAQCSNCQFQNMPGVTHCGRCGTSLMLRTAVIDVHPPRATRWAKMWRRTIMARLIRPVRESSRSMVRQWGVSPDAQLPPPGVLGRLIVPGWAQIYDGRTTLGRSLLLGYGVCMLAAVACFGSVVCSVLLGMAFACHGISVYDVARRTSPGIPDRIFRVMLGCGLLAAVLYLPSYSLATSFVNPIVMQANRLPLHEGDVLLVNSSAYVRSTPGSGDVVLYEMADMSVGGQTEFGAAARFIFRGPHIDRVLAGPGQVIVWDGVRLTVDGQPSSVVPLNPNGAGQRLSFTVPTDSYFILPSTDLVNGQFQATEENWKSWSTVPLWQIEGRVIWRSWPWTRMGFVR